MTFITLFPRRSKQFDLLSSLFMFIVIWMLFSVAETVFFVFFFIDWGDVVDMSDVRQTNLSIGFKGDIIGEIDVYDDDECFFSFFGVSFLDLLRSRDI